MKDSLSFHKKKKKDIMKPIGRQFRENPEKFINFLNGKKRWITGGKIVLGILLIIAILTIVLMVRKVEKPSIGEKMIAPEFAGINSWINSQPLNMSMLKDKVVLVNFWSYSSGDSLKAVPYLNEWHEKYSKKGLVIIGVHSPEFKFEENIEDLEKAVDDLNIKYAVVADNSHQTEKAFQNTYHPGYFLIDKNNVIRLEHRGKGGFLITEIMIRKLLKETGKNVGDVGITIERTDKIPLLLSPKIYAGYRMAKTGLGNEKGYLPGRSVSYESVAEGLMDDNKIYLYGKWFNAEDYLKHDELTVGYVVVKYYGKEAYIFAKGKEKVRVVLDKEAIRTEISGDDIIYENGDSFLNVSEGKLYNVVKDNEPGFHVLKILSDTQDFSVYSLEFR